MNQLEIVIRMTDEDDFSFRYAKNRKVDIIKDRYVITDGHDSGLKKIKLLCREFINEDSEAFTPEYRKRLKSGEI